MNKIKLLFYACSPFAIGYFLNYAMLKNDWHYTSAISILFFVYWFFVGYVSQNYASSIKESILFGNSLSAVCLFLIVFQEVILERYMPNIIGMAPQMFYLPTLGVAVTIERILMFFVSSHRLWATCILAFVLMVAVYYAGYKMRLKKVQRAI